MKINHITHHKDGSIRAKGSKMDGVFEECWEWLRKDGTKMRSGYFENGEKCRENHIR